MPPHLHLLPHFGGCVIIVILSSWIYFRVEGYRDTDGDKKVILIVKAAPGETAEQGDDVRFWKYNLQFQTKKGNSWKARDLLPFISPAGATTAANRMVALDFGSWRIRAHTTSFRYPNGMWSEWRNFHVSTQIALKAPSALQATFRSDYGPGVLLS